MHFNGVALLGLLAVAFLEVFVLQNGIAHFFLLYFALFLFLGAGLYDGQRRHAESERRLALVGQFSQKASTRVYFDTGSATINAEGRQALQSIANQANAIPGSLLRVVGFTDSSGSVAANTRLSNQRASAVTAYLLKNLNVPPEKIATAGGLGSYVPVDNEDAGGNSAKNRRVTVFVIVSKASETDVTPASASTAPTRAAP